MSIQAKYDICCAVISPLQNGLKKSKNKFLIAVKMARNVDQRDIIFRKKLP
jgi:hypothetical protein